MLLECPTATEYASVSLPLVPTVGTGRVQATTIAKATRGVLSLWLDIVERICSDRACGNDVGSREWSHGRHSMVVQDRVCGKSVYGRGKRNRRSSGIVEVGGRVDP